jgi:hypothetical protein
LILATQNGELMHGYNTEYFLIGTAGT